MSLISIENFAEPFRNKIHLVTIFMVAAVFGVLRMQGGNVTFENANPDLRGRYEVAPAQAPARQNTYQRREPQNTQPAANTQQRNSGSKGSSLDDIERSLGLR